MNKILSRILSTALATTLAIPAFADSQLISRAVEPGQTDGTCSGMERALPKGVLTVRGLSRRPDLGMNGGQENGFKEQTNRLVAPRITGPAKVKALDPSTPLPKLIGAQVYPDKALMNIPVSDSQEYTTLISGVNAMSGGALKDDIYIATNYSSFFGYTFIYVDGYNIETGKKAYSYQPTTFDYVLDAITYDATTDQYYAVGFNASGVGLQLCTVDYTPTGATFNHIAEFNYDVAALAVDSEGQLYGILMTLENEVVTEAGLSKIDKATGEVTAIANLSELPYHRSSAVIDPKSNILYYPIGVKGSTESWMTTVNMTTGEVTRILQLPDNTQIKGLQYVPVPEPDAPSAATDLSLDFPEGTLTGHVNFTVPATYYDGSAATGEVSYTVLTGGETVATGTANFGDEVAAVVEVDKAGDYEFTVILTNEAGDSPKARVKGFIGNGVPKAPVAAIAYADGQITITWEAVTESVDAGYIAVDQMKYIVTNVTTGEVVADNIEATSWSVAQEEPAELTNFVFSVTATCNEIKSAATQVSILLGSIVPPYSNSLSTQADLDVFQVIDANGDGKTWHIESNYAICSFNNAVDTDDWLVTAPLQLEANTAYYVTLKVGGRGTSYPEKFEVCCGMGNTPADLTSTVIEPTEVKTDLYAFNQYGGYMITDEAGRYYLGIHGISKRDMYALCVCDLNISEGRPALAPAESTDLEIVPASYGALFANITFTAPTKSIAGTDLTEISKIEIARDGEVFAVKTNVAPGAAVKVADSVDEHGTYTYTVTAYTGEDAGLVATKQAYIGVPVPAAVSAVNIEFENPTVTLTWTAVSRDIYNNPISTEQVTYNILNENLTIIDEGLTETNWTYTYEGQEQQFLMFGIQSATEGGRSQGVYGTNLIAMGPAYPGMKESFPNGDNDGYIFYTTSVGGGKWLKCSDDGLNGTSKFSNIKAYDGDNGFLAMQGSNVDNSATIVSGIISLDNTENPGLSLYTYVIYEDEEADLNEIQIAVSKPNTYDFVPLDTIVVKDLGLTGWRKATVKLDEYAGQDIQIAITAVTKSYVYTPIDNIVVGSLFTKDLSAHDVLAPSKVVAGDDYSVNVEVINEGIDTIASYTVELYANGEVVDTKTCEAINPEESTFVEFTRSFTPFDTESVIYMAHVVYADDQYTFNNTTAEIVVEPVPSVLPAPTELKGDATDQGNVLTWGEPDLSGVLPDAYTETFESAEDFSMTYQDWIFVDLDEAIIGGLSGMTLPNIPTMTGPASWFVFDASNEQFVNNTTFWGPGGKKDLHYLACLYNKNMSTNNDWAISPELFGKAQTISFSTKAYNAYYAEKFEVWYSTGSTDPAEFTQLSEAISVKSQTWTEYSFDLPDGAKRFAIRCCSTGAYMLFLDNVKFIPAGAQVTLEIAGYDIYRDGVKLNSEVVAETTFTDSEAEAGKPYTYNVVTVYNIGASLPSNDCELTTSGLDDIFGGINIAAGKGEVIITGAEGLAVQVVAVDGKVLFSGIADTKTTVAVLPGVYVVKAGDKIAKLLVR